MDALIPFTTSGSLVDIVDSESTTNLVSRCFALYSSTSRQIEKVLIVLRDGRNLIGVLRSYDQYGEQHVEQLLSGRSKSHPLSLLSFSTSANLVLEAAVERIYHGLQYAELPRGLFLIRGENVVLLGEVVSSTLIAVPSFRRAVTDGSICRILISRMKCHFGKHHGKRCTAGFRQKRYVGPYTGLMQYSTLRARLAQQNQEKKAQPVKERELQKLGFTVEGQEGDAY